MQDPWALWVHSPSTLSIAGAGDNCGEARRKNDGRVDRAILLKCENKFDWWSAYGDGTISTDDGVTRLSDRK